MTDVVSTVWVIGIGTGDPGLLTYEAAKALRQVDVFIVADKGGAKHDLVEARRALCEHAVGGSHPYRFVEVPDPQRGPDAERNATAYDTGVRDWHAARVAAYATIMDDLPDDSQVGFLVWGDPAFYDSSLRIVDAMQAQVGPFHVRVIPGISAPQLLAARHAIPLNRIGAPIHITTGRRLIEEYSPELGDVVVMLDGHLACRGLVEEHSPHERHTRLLLPAAEVGQSTARHHRDPLALGEGVALPCSDGRWTPRTRKVLQSDQMTPKGICPLLALWYDTARSPTQPRTPRSAAARAAHQVNEH